MINFFGKSLVLVHTILSIAAMTFALWVFLKGRDYAFIEPRKEAVDWSVEGKETKWVRHASEYDKSVVALREAAKTRDIVYTAVKPALDSISATEPYLPQNTLFYRAELKRLYEAPDKIEVRRLKEGGLLLENPLAKPSPDDKVVPGVNKSFTIYKNDLKAVTGEIAKLEEEISKEAKDTKTFTRELTGTDEGNKYVEPGLYQLIDREFKAQTQLKIEIDDIKPYWSKAIEQANLYRYRQTDLRATLERLKTPAPKVKKQL